MTTDLAKPTTKRVSLDIVSGHRKVTCEPAPRADGFIQATREALDTFMARRLGYRMRVVLKIDGIQVGRHLVAAALGIDWAGHKQILGLAEGANENGTVVKSLLRGRTQLRPCRGLTGHRPVAIQRCIAHKIRDVRENVPESVQSVTRHRLRKVYQEPDVAQALKKPRALARGLVQYP